MRDRESVWGKWGSAGEAGGEEGLEMESKRSAACRKAARGGGGPRT